MTTDSTNIEPASAQSELGERVDTDTLRFVRRFKASPQRVWHALTTPEGIAAWLGRPVRIEVHAGGTFEVAIGEEHLMDGRIIACEPGSRLEIDWHETSDGVSQPYGTQPGDRSCILFELVASAEGGTVLTFTHRCIQGGETMIGFGAGWHAHLERLDAWLSGSAEIDPSARYAALEPRYREQLAT